ncbi:MAG: FecR domain-containing protein [Deltaproteobacteria bacterium]|nr:FecR domain-containing protein [Deltaproteobacteria bacterium]
MKGVRFACVLGLSGLLGTLCLSVGRPNLAAAQTGTFRYRVQAGDTCAGIARRLYGSSRDYERIHELNPGLGLPPHSLEPGSVLVLPRPPDDGPDARVTGTENDVRARAPGGRFVSAAVGDELVRGHRVETGADSSAELTFRDRSTVQMRERTLVIVYGGSERLARRRRAASLERGVLRGRLSELTGRLAVDTPAGTARIVGGDAIVAVGEDGASRLANHGGRSATITGNRVSVEVPPGTGTVVRHGARPSPPRPLPEPPRWKPDQPGRFVGLTGRGGTVSGEFEDAEGAVAYRIEVARRPDGTDVAAAIEVPAVSTNFRVHRLPAGVYYVAVATIDEWLLEGRPSPRRAVQVLEARIIPPGGGEPVVAPYDPGDPSQPDRPPRVLPGTWVVAPVGFTCGLHGGALAGMSTLRGDGRTAVACSDPAGRPVPSFDVVLEAPMITVDDGAPAIVLDGGAVVIDRRAEVMLRLRVDGPLALPAGLVAWGPPGVDVGRPRRLPGSMLEVPVAALTDGPSEFAINIGVAEGNDRVSLGHVSVVVRAPDPVRPPHPLRSPDDAPSPRTMALGAFSLAPSVDAVALLPVGEGRARFHGAASAMSQARDDGIGTFRADFGARARPFGIPLEVGFDWVVDARGDYDVASRLGHGDLRVSTSVSFDLSPALRLIGDVTAWLPTHAAVGTLGTVRVVPSLSLEGSFVRPLWLRTRQAVIADTTGDTLSWASAYGADVRFFDDRLTLGVELQFVAGQVSGTEMVALGLGAEAGFLVGPMEILLGLRMGVGQDAAPIFGAFTGVVALRFTL